jgi:putative ubiquitin-RnfH superfamily antitoxin RatB of RatAB toxin-antitoxin module
VAEEITIEVAFAAPDCQLLEKVVLTAGATVADAIRRSGIESRCPGYGLDTLDAGIWGRVVPRERVLRDGDRVELYRPLRVDPRDARRQRAAKGLTMADGGTGGAQSPGSSS